MLASLVAVGMSHLAKRIVGVQATAASGPRPSSAPQAGPDGQAGRLITAYLLLVVRYRVLISGRVQGVFFRDTCRRLAVEHGVAGWVRNLPDGRVEAVFEGAAEDVGQLVNWAHSGPRLATVQDVAVQAEPPEGLDAFQIK
jgi:acylphosphatase